MEESEKTYGKKKLPSIPSNYVTLLQLQERWNKEKERKEKQEVKETNVEDSVPGRGTRNNHQFNRDNGKRVAEVKPRDDKTATEDLDNEKKGEELKKKKKKKKKQKKKSKEKKRNEMEEKARAANEGENTGNAPLPASTERDKGEEQLIRYELHAPKLASGKEKDVEARKEWKPRLNTTHGRKAETGRKFQATKRSKGEVELIGDEVHAPEVASVGEENVEAIRESRPRLTTRTHGRKAEIGRKFQATESSKGEKELIGDEVHAPMLASVKEENVEARRESESQPMFNPRTHGRTAETGLKFEAMSVNGVMRKGGNLRYGRQHFNFNQRRGGNWDRINEGMVWVKKVEVEDQNVTGLQSSSKELY